jgi:putative ABC transport system permease protein
MIKLLFKTAFRNIRKDLYQTILNIFGLALGFAALLFISTYFFHELSFDKFHEKANRIYRCVAHAKIGGTEEILSNSEITIAAASKNDLPEVEDATRLFYAKYVTVKVAGNKYIEDKFWFADANFLQIFDFKLLEGDKKLVLSQPNSIILTEDYSKKYFGNKNPIGQSIVISDNSDVYQVTGVLKNIPLNSHMQFGMLASFSSLPLSKRNEIIDWGNFRDLYTFLLIKENVDIKTLNEKFQEFPMKYYKSMFALAGINMEDFEKKGGFIKHILQPLSEVHLDNTFTDNVFLYGNRQLLYALGIIGLFILIIACFNFINLSTARASLRAKEIGMKKILGSSRRSLIALILTETFLQCCIALLAAIIFLIFSLGLLNRFTNLNIEFGQFFNKFGLITIILIPVIVVGIAGIFPSFVISKYNPAEVIKGSVLKWNSNSGLRNALVAFQFIVFIALVSVTVIVKKQVYLLHNQNPGFHKENVLVVKNTNKLGNNAMVFKNEMLKEGQTINAAYTSMVPSIFDGDSNPFSKTDKKEQVFLKRVDADKDFIETLKIKILDGRGFAGNANDEKGNAIINKKAAEIFGWSDCRDKIIYDYNDGGKYFNVIGITENFHLESLRNEVEPAIIRCSDNGNYLAIRIQPESATKAIASAKMLWEQSNDKAPFEFTFLDVSFDSQYRNEVRFGRMVSLFSIISIVIACLGLLGLVSFTLSRKRKEICIRKVNGAMVSEVLAMLNRDFIKWVIIAFAVATPVAWYIMHKWLESFAYKTALSWWVFALAGLLALGITLLTVTWQSWRAATRNPVEALRYE